MAFTRRRGAEDLTFLENAPHERPRELFIDAMASNAHVVHTMVGPEAPLNVIDGLIV